MACVEEDDCRVLCGEDQHRVKRAVDNSNSNTNKGRTEDGQEKLEIRVVSLPEDSETTTATDSGTSVSECRLYLIVTLATALTFCLLSGAIVVFACLRKENCAAVRMRKVNNRVFLHKFGKENAERVNI